MADLLNDTPDASVWVNQAIREYTNVHVYEKMVSAIIWTDDIDPEKLVGIENPSAYIAEINTAGWPIFKGHDPGFPVGRVLAANLFTKLNGTRFIAAILGMYGDRQQLSFGDLGLDSTPNVSSPLSLNSLSDDCWLEFAADPREVDAQWMDDVIQNAPLRVERIKLSHNGAVSQGELIRLGLVFVAIVWNPFVTTIAKEAGKDVYAGIHQWLRSLWDKLVERQNPIVVVQSYQDGCEISFLFRGKDVKRNYDAHDALPIAAAQAAKLIAEMRSREVAPASLVYEFEPQISRWFPSYATLNDGRLISDCNILIAIEQLPTDLSIGVECKR
ncbi:MAG: hypothetical protein PHI97_14620 [Desulfobulbus sp.]|nr:hypothetical protein [Desulfobulbus sp.]